MNSDNYEFAKSSEAQSASNYTAYTDKQWNYINDINSGVYSNNSGLTLIQWDLTSIYNSAGFSDASDLYLAVPIMMTAAYSTGAAVVPIDPATTTSANYALMSLKSNYQHLIHQIEIVCNGKTCEQMQPFVSVAKNFQLLSTMSATDLKSMNISLGISETLDNERSVQFNGTAAASKPGVGLCNNVPWGTSASTDVPLVQSQVQNTGTVNSAIQRRLSRIVDASKVGGTSFNNIYGAFGADNTTPTIMSATQLSADIKPYFAVSGNIMTWVDVGLIPLKYLSDFIDKLGLVKKLDLVIRAYFNTGSLSVTTVNPGLANCGFGAFANSTFSNTCPFTLNFLPGVVANGGIPTTATNIVAGLFIGKVPTTSILGVNLGAGSIGHPMPAARCYYSQVALDPSRALTYVRENTEKQIVYEQLLFNQYTQIAVGASFSQLIQSGIKNPISVLIIPFISSTCGSKVTAGALAGPNFGFNQYGSPYDTSPSTYSPISLTNLSITLGGVNVLNTSLNYTYENFLSQVVTAESLTSSDVGISVGLITQSWWESNRVYFIDLARSNAADREMPRNLNISFNNNTLIPIDIMVFTIYLDKIVLNVQTGQVTK